MYFTNDAGALVFCHNGERIRIEAWGKDSLRVRSTMLGCFSGKEWALTENIPKSAADIVISEASGTGQKRENAVIRNGRLKAAVNFAGVITFYKDDQEILREYYRMYDGTISRESRCLKVINREWKGIIGGTEYSLNVKFESNEEEKIFGMGQYQQPHLNLKGCILELAQRNSQASVPLLISARG